MALFSLEVDKDQRMIPKVLAHAGKIVHYRYPVAFEMHGRANTRQHKQLRVGYGAAAEHDLVCFGDELLPTALDLHTGDALAIEN